MQTMNLRQKREKLLDTYRQHDEQGAYFREKAVCGPGCAYCCTHYGHLDVTTLEGLIILKKIKTFAKAEQNRIQKRIFKNKRDKEAKKPSVCPFLTPDKTCLIYEQRPFSCRQLYSLKICGEHGPLVHPQAVAQARETVKRIQQLDHTGYSGHLSYVLALLEQKPFYRLYTAGGFDPAGIAGFGKSHSLSINRQSAGGKE
ncbi:MAG: YkgJ family cysteine cluster protein [Desulfohalobiaceae bacterium]|nr:YkgJ family cysteine cluster protein [Desulfohalobiaceae bacterium]